MQYTILRESDLSLTGGSCCAALVLNLLRNLQNKRARKDKAWEWVTIARSRIAEMILGQFKDKAIAAGIKLLVSLGFIERRQVPNRAGRYYQYRVADSPELSEPDCDRDKQQLDSDPSELDSDLWEPDGDRKPNEPCKPLDSANLPKGKFKSSLGKFNPPEGKLANPETIAITEFQQSRETLSIKETSQNNKSIEKDELIYLEPVIRKDSQGLNGKSQKQTSDSRWESMRTEFDRDFRPLVARFLNETLCTPRDVAFCAGLGVDRVAECEINETVIRHCLSVGKAIVERAIDKCLQHKGYRQQRQFTLKC